MIVKGVIDEDFINYKKPSMIIEMPTCTFKCDKDYGKPICQNSNLVIAQNIEIDALQIIYRYLTNPITKAIVFQGLEPFDSFDDMISIIYELRQNYMNQDDIIIYTGYNKDEIKNKIEYLKKYPNIIIKFGRYIPNQSSHFDDILGVKLASSNQYAERIS